MLIVGLVLVLVSYWIVRSVPVVGGSFSIGAFAPGRIGTSHQGSPLKSSVGTEVT